MAHFAKIGIDNKVLSVSVLDNINNMTRGGLEQEAIGVEFLKNVHGHESWVQCSYWASEGYRWAENEELGRHKTDQVGFRANFPQKGWFWDSTNEIFYPPRPVDEDGDSCTSHTVNTTTGMWDAPIAKPDDLTDDNFVYWRWDESAYQSDNTQGWVAVTND